MSQPLNILRLLILSSVVSFSEGAISVPLNLKEALVESLQHNFEIRINSTSLADKQAAYTKALGNFDFQLSTMLSKDHNETPSASSLDGVATAVVTDNQTLKPTLSTKTKIGTDISLPYTYVITDSNSSYATIPVSHNTSFGLKLTQPILRAFHRGYFTKDLTKANLQIESAKQKYGQQLFDSCEKTLDLYLETLRDHQSLKVKENSVDLSQQTYDLAKMKHELGKISLVDLLEAEGVLLKSKESLITTSTALESKYADLQIAVFANSAVKIEIAEDLANYLSSPPNEISEEKLIQQALRNRPELKVSEISVQEARLDVKHAQADKMPVLNFEGSVTFKGVADSYQESQEQINQRQFSSYSTGLKLEQPIMRYAVKGEVRQKNLRLQQEDLRRAQSVRTVELNVRKDLRTHQSNWQRLELINEMAEAERERFKGQNAKFRQGKISVFDLTRSQQDLESAELELIKAKVAYTQSRLNLAVSTGTLFEDLGIQTK